MRGGGGGDGGQRLKRRTALGGRQPTALAYLCIRAGGGSRRCGSVVVLFCVKQERGCQGKGLETMQAAPAAAPNTQLIKPVTGTYCSRRATALAYLCVGGGEV